MSALAGVLDAENPPKASDADRMLAAAPHRGADREVLVRGACALGIVRGPDRTDAWLADETDIAVAFTGALDNLEELAAELDRLRSPAASRTPASVVAALFRNIGEEAPPRMRGTFTVAVTDGETLWAFRDQLGFRLLFYRRGAASMHLATEAKQVVAGAGIAKEPDLDVLERIFLKDYDDATPSALRGVSRLPKATLLRARGREVHTRRYWRPERLLEAADHSPDEIRERFELLMDQAVTRVLTGSDVVSLSGGIDSPAVAAFASPASERRFGHPIAAITAVFPHLPSVDEREYVELVAARYRMPLETFERTAQPLEGLRRWVELLDGPVPTILVNDAAEHYRTVRELGFRTMLTGEIAELVTDMRRHLIPHLIRRGRFGPAWAHVRGQRRKGVPLAALARQAGSGFVPRWMAQLYLRARPPRRGDRVPPWLSIEAANAGTSARPAGDRWRHQQLVGFVGPGLTMEADEIVQATARINSRRPFADVDLWEFFLSLPAEVKFPDVTRKGLLRSLLRGRVPDEILDRREKTVFNDSIMERIDYGELRHWLWDPKVRIRGVDYAGLRDQIERKDMNLFEYTWAKDLAAVHAFLDLW